VCDVNVESIVAPAHSWLPTVNSPFGPPSIVSSNDVTGAAGGLSSVVTRRFPLSVVAASIGTASRSLASRITSRGTSPGRRP